MQFYGCKLSISKVLPFLDLSCYKHRNQKLPNVFVAKLDIFGRHCNHQMILPF